jgi:hypothetical protein
MKLYKKIIPTALQRDDFVFIINVTKLCPAKRLYSAYSHYSTRQIKLLVFIFVLISVNGASLLPSRT